MPSWTPEQLAEFATEMGVEPDEAAHMLVDMGEITSDEHEELLSPEEATRIYGTE